MGLVNSWFKQRQNWIWPGFVYGTYVVCILMLQGWMGAQNSEFSMDPDQPAHYLNGVLVKDFIAARGHGDIVNFATEFYKRRPFIAIGHWPPVYYILEGLWMSVVGIYWASMLQFVAVTGGVAALLVWKFSGANWASWFNGLLLLLLPITHGLLVQVMTDMLLTGLVVGAVVSLGLFWSQRGMHFWVLFWAFTVLALLTKMSTLELVLMPLLWLRLGDWKEWLRNKWFWLAPVLASLPVISWLAVAHKYMEGGFIVGLPPWWVSLWDLLGQFSTSVGGWAGLAALGAGWLWGLRMALKGDGFWWALSMFPALHLIYIMVMPIPKDPRYMLPIVPILLVITWRCGEELLSALWRGPRKQIAGLVLAGVALGWGYYGWQQRPVLIDLGLRPLVDWVQSKGKNQRVLAPSLLEGAFVAGYEMRGKSNREDYVIRPRKLLARMDWNSQLYLGLYHSEEAVAGILEQASIDRVLILEGTYWGKPQEHDVLLCRLMKTQPDLWEYEQGYKIYGGTIAVYRSRRERSVKGLDEVIWQKILRNMNTSPKKVRDL